MNSMQAQDGRPTLNDVDADKVDRQRKWRQRFSKLFSRDDSPSTRQSAPPLAPPAPSELASDPRNGQKPNPGRRFSRQAIPGLPRPATFRRQMSERRDRLSPSDMPHAERRTLSVDRRRAFSARPASPFTSLDPRMSAPSVYETPDTDSTMRTRSIPPLPQQEPSHQANLNAMLMKRPTGPPTPPPDEPSHIPGDGAGRQDAAFDIQAELESRWILNLSMHFRDKSPREKFFVTYAETPNRWRRVTVSCDYRNAPPESLEADLCSLRYQRDKSARIYESIRSSLLDIQFYDTVTNLRLETSADERLHVHVTEDVNEIIPYPSQHLLSHLDYDKIRRVPESEVHFISHMSGFVYKVHVDGEILIKKEIPGPDSVEEFLYEINALEALVGSKTVVQIRGLVVDESMGTVTGLLIDYYEEGPLVDILFDNRGRLTWERKAKWATQIIQGLSEIHEAGYVQGDFTVSNICVGADDDARIIDINRRGCPVGWEPPEIARMIESGQRISMYIGVKSDLFQLGMVLWAIAAEDDEPERQQRPLTFDAVDEQKSRGIHGDWNTPLWYKELTFMCMRDRPKDRPSASSLLAMARQPSSLSLALTRRNSSASKGNTSMNRDAQTSSGITPSPEAGATTIMSTNAALNDEQASRSNEVMPVKVDRRRESTERMRNPADDCTRGRSPPRNTAHLRGEWHRSCDSVEGMGVAEDARPPIEVAEDNDEPELEPEIVPINPTGEGWREILSDGHTYIVRADELGDAVESNSVPAFERPVLPPRRRSHEEVYGPAADEDWPPAPELPFAPEAPELPEALEPPPDGSLPRAFRHIDSGLADMHLSDDEDNDGGRHATVDRGSNEYSSANHARATTDVYDHQPAWHTFRHYDSGLSDMDLDLAGVGSHQHDQFSHRTTKQAAARAKHSEEGENGPLNKIGEEDEGGHQSGRATTQRWEEEEEECIDRDDESETGDHYGGVTLVGEQAREISRMIEHAKEKTKAVTYEHKVLEKDKDDTAKSRAEESEDRHQEQKNEGKSSSDGEHLAQASKG